MAERQSPSAGEVSKWVYRGVVVLATFFPPWAATLFDENVLENKTLTFIAVYFLTLPWTLAVTIIAAAVFGDYFSNLPSGAPVWIVAGILVGAEVIGVVLVNAAVPGLGEVARVPGPPIGKALYLIAWTVAGYAFIYGPALWISGFLVGGFCGWWINEKILRRLS